MLVAKGDCCALWVNKEFVQEDGLVVLYYHPLHIYLPVSCHRINMDSGKISTK